MRAVPGGVRSSRAACSCPVGFHTGERPLLVHLQVLLCALLHPGLC